MGKSAGIQTTDDGSSHRAPDDPPAASLAFTIAFAAKKSAGFPADPG